MSILNLGQCNDLTRSLLNDEEAADWPDQKLRLKVQMAFEELEAELMLAGIPIIDNISIILNIPINNFDDINLDMSSIVGYPNDIIIPIWMKERQLGEQNRDFIDMVECDFIPNVDRDVTLAYWAWIGGTIMLRGALNPTQVQLRYVRLLTVPVVNTDSLIVPLVQIYLPYKIAALCAYSVGDRTRWEDLKMIAAENLDRIVRINIKQLQDTPAKRRPYHRGQGRNRVLRDF